MELTRNQTCAYCTPGSASSGQRCTECPAGTGGDPPVVYINEWPLTGWPNYTGTWWTGCNPPDACFSKYVEVSIN